MVRAFSKIPKKPAGWVPPSAPLSQRKQVFLYVHVNPEKRIHFPITKKQKWLTRTARPEFTIALVRTPFLPPRYASFHVPLSFNKLDMRDYLQRVYGVGVVGVRSYIEQQKVTRMRPLGRWGYGRVRRPESKKRMTVEMKEPFVWPEAPTDMAPWEKDQFFKAAKYQSDVQQKNHPDAAMKPNKPERESYEEEAKELLQGKKSWRPTWQALGLSYDRSAVARGSTGSGS